MIGGKRGLLIPFIIVICITLLLAATSFFLTIPPTYCKGCHQMEPYYDSWKVSTHGQVHITCVSCHVKPEFLPTVLFKLNFYRNIYGQLTHQKLRPLAIVTPPVKACRQCHSLNRVRSTSGDLKINHRIHVAKAKLKCTFCHSGVVHSGVGKLKKMNPPRKLCVECHQDQMNNCSYCHVIRKGELEEFKHFDHI